MNDAEHTIYQLLQHFVERQQIVFACLRHVRPDMIMRFEGRATPQERSEMRQKFWRTWDIGFWGERLEWRYRVHGIGCHLTHRKTNEIIGWDVGHPRWFDKNWFVNWLVWFVEYHPETHHAVIVNKILSEPIEQHDERRDEFRYYMRGVYTTFVNNRLIRGAFGNGGRKCHCLFIPSPNPPPHWLRWRKEGAFCTIQVSPYKERSGGRFRGGISCPHQSDAYWIVQLAPKPECTPHSTIR